VDQIAYRSGYKYQLAVNYLVALPQFNGLIQSEIKTKYISLTKYGDTWVLVILAGYAWDGATGAFDFMRPSLVHDALYQLMRMGFLVEETHRIVADQILRETFLEDRDAVIEASGHFVYVRKKAARVRAGYIYIAVRQFAKGAATSDPKEIQYAPGGQLWVMK